MWIHDKAELFDITNIIKIVKQFFILSNQVIYSPNNLLKVVVTIIEWGMNVVLDSLLFVLIFVLHPVHYSMFLYVQLFKCCLLLEKLLHCLPKYAMFPFCPL